MFSNSSENPTSPIVEASASTAHNKAVTLAMFTMVVYDYALNIDLEIDLVWSKEISLVSVLYGLLRYVGFLWAGLELMLSLGMQLSQEACFSIYATMITTELVIPFLLQAMMILRVYALLGQSKRVLVRLLACFFVAQATSFASIFSLLATGPSLVSTSGPFPNAETCVYTLPSNRRWSWPLAAGIVCVFEVVLCGFVLHYAFKHSKARRLRSPVFTAGTLMKIMVRDNLLYFILAFVDLLIAAAISAPSLHPSGPFNDILLAAEFGFNAMLGPWLVLSIRKQRHKTAVAAKYFDGDAWRTFDSTLA